MEEVQEEVKKAAIKKCNGCGACARACQESAIEISALLRWN